MILLFFGGYKAIEGIIQDPTTPLILKVGIIALLGGLVVLLVSIIRERIFVRKRERYKEVEK
jgi:tetrahydromethanopterin S-methyltransferase subunit E